jgi:hypothetical protein
MRITRVLCLVPVLISLASQWCEFSYGSELSFTGRQSLIDKYHKIGEEPKIGPSALPFFLESSESNNTAYVDIYSTMNYRFGIMKNQLLIPDNWCEIVLPHPDIRACTYKKTHDIWLLNIYSVNKFSKPLGDAYQMKFLFHINDLQSSYFDIALTASEGPFNTADHRLGFEAAPLNEDTTLIHLRYAFSYSSWGYFLMKLFGGGKIGFSVVDTDSNGTPVYVSGPRGAAERNAVRFYLAILAYFDTFEIPAEQRFEKQINQWYDLAAPFRKQLLEMEKDKYITYKRQDQKNQQKLQSALNE